MQIRRLWPLLALLVQSSASASRNLQQFSIAQTLGQGGFTQSLLLGGQPGSSSGLTQALVIGRRSLLEKGLSKAPPVAAQAWRELNPSMITGTLTEALSIAQSQGQSGAAATTVATALSSGGTQAEAVNAALPVTPCNGGRPVNTVTTK